MCWFVVSWTLDREVSQLVQISIMISNRKSVLIWRLSLCEKSQSDAKSVLVHFMGNSSTQDDTAEGNIKNTKIEKEKHDHEFRSLETHVLKDNQMNKHHVLRDVSTANELWRPCVYWHLRREICDVEEELADVSSTYCVSANDQDSEFPKFFHSTYIWNSQFVKSRIRICQHFQVLVVWDTHRVSSTSRGGLLQLENYWDDTRQQCNLSSLAHDRTVWDEILNTERRHSSIDRRSRW